MTLETMTPMTDDLVISLPAISGRSNRPPPTNTVTISASYITSRNCIPMREITKLILREDAGWDAHTGASLEHAPIDQALFADAPRKLSQGATELYRRLASAPDYLAWWAAASGGSAPGPRRFAIETSADHWERPWEATIAALQPKRWPDVTMLRLVAGQSASPAKRDVGAPLRIMILQGRAAHEGFQDLDLAAELAALNQAHSNLDAAARRMVCPPEARCVGFKDIVPALIEFKPTILWCSGQPPKSDPSSRVRVSSKSRKMSRGSKMPVSSAKRQNTIRTRNCSRSWPV